MPRPRWCRSRSTIQQKGLQLVENRHNGGVASGLDLAQQQTLLDSTVTQLYLVQAAARAVRARHRGADRQSGFHLQRAGRAAERDAGPPVPLGVPSDLLERRPDIATAERQMAYQNAQVGVATAAFYPQLTLFGSGGFQSTNITNLISAPSAIWSLGGDLLQPIFNGGRNRANLAATKHSLRRVGGQLSRGGAGRVSAGRRRTVGPERAFAGGHERRTPPCPTRAARWRSPTIAMSAASLLISTSSPRRRRC